MSNLTTIPNSQNCGCIHPPDRTAHPCFPETPAKQPAKQPSQRHRTIYMGPRGVKMPARDWLTVGRTMWNLHQHRDQFIQGRRRLDMPHYPGPQYAVPPVSK
jgi:hypothetical protein